MAKQMLQTQHSLRIIFLLNKAIVSLVEDTTTVAAEEGLVDQQVQHPDTRMSENVITAATLLISMPLVETD
jgi:hypothetical protein